MFNPLLLTSDVVALVLQRSASSSPHSALTPCTPYPRYPRVVSATFRHSGELVAHMSKDNPGQRYPIAGLPREAIDSGRLVCVNDCSAERGRVHTSALQYFPGAMMCCPIIASTTTDAARRATRSVIGVLQVSTAKGGPTFRSDHRLVVSSVCELLSDTLVKLQVGACVLHRVRAHTVAVTL